jgi:hypothetical protein
MRCLATVDRFDTRRSTQPTVGELLLSSVIHFSLKVPHTPSIASHSKRSPAISKSEFDIMPRGLSKVLMFSITSPGHCHRNTVGMHDVSSPVPLMPWPDGSTIPTKSGQPHVSSRHFVGSRVDSRRSIQHPSIAVSSRWLQLRSHMLGMLSGPCYMGIAGPLPLECM